MDKLLLEYEDFTCRKLSLFLSAATEARCQVRVTFTSPQVKWVVPGVRTSCILSPVVGSWIASHLHRKIFEKIALQVRLISMYTMEDWRWKMYTMEDWISEAQRLFTYIYLS